VISDNPDAAQTVVVVVVVFDSADGAQPNRLMSSHHFLHSPPTHRYEAGIWWLLFFGLKVELWKKGTVHSPHGQIYITFLIMSWWGRCLGVYICDGRLLTGNPVFSSRVASCIFTLEPTEKAINQTNGNYFMNRYYRKPVTRQTWVACWHAWETGSWWRSL
jgi:hypothetical protein